MGIEQRRGSGLALAGATLCVLSQQTLAQEMGPPDTSVRVSVGTTYSEGRYARSRKTRVLSVPLTVRVARGGFSLRVSVPYVVIEGPGTLLDGARSTTSGGGSSASSAVSGDVGEGGDSSVDDNSGSGSGSDDGSGSGSGGGTDDGSGSGSGSGGTDDGTGSGSSSGGTDDGSASGAVDGGSGSTGGEDTGGVDAGSGDTGTGDTGTTGDTGGSATGSGGEDGGKTKTEGMVASTPPVMATAATFAAAIPAAAASAPRNRRSGLGDVTVTLGYSADIVTGLSLQASARVKLPTASRKQAIGTGKVDTTLAAELVAELGDATLHAGGRRRFLGRPTGWRIRDGWGFGAGGSYRLPGGVQIGADYDWLQSATPGRAPISEATAWVSLPVSRRIRLQGYAGTGFTSRSADFLAGLSVAARF